MDTKKRVKVYPCKTILSRLRETDPDSVYRLRLRLPHDYEEACSLCEEKRLVREWRYRYGEGPFRGVVRVGLQRSYSREEKGLLGIARSPFCQGELENRNPSCYLLTKARVPAGRPDLLKGLTQGGYHALPFTTSRADGVARILDPLLPPSSASPRGLLDIKIERGTLLIPVVPPFFQERCIIKSAAKWGGEAFVIGEPLLEEILVLTQGEQVTLFVQGIEDEMDSSMEFGWSNAQGERILGRYLDISTLKPGSHHLVCNLVRKNGLSDVATLNIFVRPSPRLSPSSLFAKAKERVSLQPNIKVQYDIFMDLSKKIGRHSGREGVERFYRVTRKLGEVELQLKIRLVDRYLCQGRYLFELGPDLLGPFLDAIENLERLDNQSIAKLFKAIARLFERPIEERGDTEQQAEQAHHLFGSVNNFVSNNFSKEDLNDLFGRIPFEPHDHNWLGSLYARRGLYEDSLQEIRLGGRENKEFLYRERSLQERFSPGLAEKAYREIKPKQVREKNNSGLSVGIEVLNTKTGKYETLQAKLRPKGEKDYTMTPPKLSSDYFDEDGNLTLRLPRER